MAKEIETKFKVDSPDKVRRLLARHDARLVSCVRESDRYYASGASRFLGVVIRLRVIDGGSGLFTIKLPPDGRTEKSFKIRDEYEIPVDDAGAFGDILAGAGCVQWFRKEKERETYSLKNAKVLLDRLPHLGWYLEIEGTKAAIKTTAKKLGFTMKNAIVKTYLDLFNEYKKNRRRPDLRLVFKR
ncbi:MAG: class IV adenylate cyclase [Candidatus Omnitrophica bacterium]|nr:class IV adenylate cyclase [Candidatus Omnitrophota bacterium]